MNKEGTSHRKKQQRKREAALTWKEEERAVALRRECGEAKVSQAPEEPWLVDWWWGVDRWVVDVSTPLWWVGVVLVLMG